MSKETAGTAGSPGARFRAAVAEERPLRVVGAINALTGMMARRAGFRALYLSGSGVAAASFGLPDLGILSLPDVAEEARRITEAVDLPLLVDIDTGFGGTELTIGRTVRTIERAGAAAVHIEDQVLQKRCGHRPGKRVVPPGEMCARLRAAVDARHDGDFVVMARTDACAVEGLESTIERAGRYVEAGADALFAEALQTLDEYRAVTEAVPAPVLANLTEFGRTPLFSTHEMASAGVAILLYPLTAFRVMGRAAEEAYRTLRAEPTQKALLERMQTREELYEILDYRRYEEKMDRFLDREEGGERFGR